MIFERLRKYFKKTLAKAFEKRRMRNPDEARLSEPSWKDKKLNALVAL